MGCVVVDTDRFHSSQVLTKTFFKGDVVVSNKLTWSWGVEIFFNTLIITICQFVFIYRVKILSDGNWWIVSVLSVLGMIQLISGITSLAVSSGASVSPGLVRT